MPNADEILINPFIADWLGSHQGAASEVRKAAEILANKPDGLEALKKLLPALERKVIYVFFSYKAKDKQAAIEVVKLLRTYSAEKLKIAYQAEFTKEITGQQWRRKITEEVCRANWFILLLPDPSDDWDWCLYETGLFDRQANSGDRLICLHHPDTQIPDPIKDYHHVPANISDVEQLLRMVYLEDNPIPGLAALNPFAESEITSIATKIVDAIRPPTRRLVHLVYEPWVVLNVENAGQLEKQDDLDSAIIEDANEDALSIFNFSVQPRTWGQMRSEIKEADGDSRWREEMFHVIRRISQGRKFYPIQAVFKSDNGQIYRPVLYAIDRVGDSGPIRVFHINFTEDVAAIDSSAIPLELSRLAMLLRFSFRFRWEVLERFAGKAINVEDVERLDIALRRMKKDWESRGIGDGVQILQLVSEDKRQRVLEMLVAWEKVKNSDGSGDLDVAIKNKDAKACSEILKGFLAMNQEFLEMTADRFNELVMNS